MTSMLFGSAICVARSRARRKQAEVARKAEIDASYLAGIESGKRKVPSHRVVNNIITTFGASPRQRSKLIRISVLDRLIDVIEAHEEAKEQTVVAIQEIITKIARFDEKQLDHLRLTASVLEQQSSQNLEDL